MIAINRMLHEHIRSLGASTYKKFLCSEVIQNWSALVDSSIADKIKPIKIERGVLLVDVEDSSLKDQLKFFSAEIIDAINENFKQEEPLVKEIRIAKGFQIADAPPAKKISAQVQPVKLEHEILFVAVKNSAFKDQLKFLAEELIETLNKNFGQPLIKAIKIAPSFQILDLKPEKIPAPIEPKIKLEEMTLTEEEIRRCEERASKISDETLRQMMLQTLWTQLKSQKFRLANGWHKCKDCETLCPPEEIFCEICEIKERELMHQELFKIFYDSPQIKAWDAQELLLKKMPYMRRECSLAAVESARTSLIQKIAEQVRFGDEESPTALKLVMLEKRLPPESLTPAIIRRTLMDLQYNLADQPKIQRYNSKAAQK